MAGRNLQTLLFLPLLLAFSFAARAQPRDTSQYAGRLYYWDDIPAYLNDQAASSLDVVTCLLKANPPNAKLNEDRKSAFLLLDNVFHQPDAPHLIAVQNYYHARMADLLAYLKTHRATSGADIYKLYNHGFIVATPDGTFAFDFTRGRSSRVDSFAISDDEARELVKQCDVLFISHLHQDHADDWVAQEFLEEHKTVVTPDSVWIDRPFYSRVQHPIRSIDSVYEIALGGNRELRYRALPGHQGNVLNNVYLVTAPNGLTFAHTGDQYNEADFSWIDGIHDRVPVDVLFPNSWSLNVFRLIRGVDPRWIVPSHEDELGHSIDHREAYWLTMNKFKKLPQKVVFMAWGEVFHINGKK